jgi:hypothetical protein
LPEIETVIVYFENLGGNIKETRNFSTQDLLIRALPIDLIIFNIVNSNTKLSCSVARLDQVDFAFRGDDVHSNRLRLDVELDGQHLYQTHSLLGTFVISGSSCASDVILSFDLVCDTLQNSLLDAFHKRIGFVCLDLLLIFFFKLPINDVINMNELFFI